ncbi:MAG: transcriptional regulator MntR [Clostridia bacterium]|nr:transcriptional regulator MntR [Bacillota bacterium]MBO2520426.1 transcriptional regulator MntR [Bacillota bacterium]
MSHKKEIRRTSKTRRPRRGSSGTPTATAEDYLERIYALIEEKGYARVSDIAEALQVRPSTVTRMVQKLDEQNLLEYQRYRGLSLTEEGERVGRSIHRRHKALEAFLHLLGVHDQATVQNDIEGIEHHLSSRTLHRLTQMVEFFEAHPDLLRRFQEFRDRRESREPAGDGEDLP